MSNPTEVVRAIVDAGDLDRDRADGVAVAGPVDDAVSVEQLGVILAQLEARRPLIAVSTPDRGRVEAAVAQLGAAGLVELVESQVVPAGEALVIRRDLAEPSQPEPAPPTEAEVHAAMSPTTGLLVDQSEAELLALCGAGDVVRPGGNLTTADVCRIGAGGRVHVSEDGTRLRIEQVRGDAWRLVAEVLR